jgi:transcriptional regulator with XRE-family HTH domain
MKLRKYRRARGVSQVELARRAGLRQSTISAYENGVAVPSRDALTRLISALGADGPEDLGYRFVATLSVEPLAEVSP